MLETLFNATNALTEPREGGSRASNKTILCAHYWRSALRVTATRTSNAKRRGTDRTFGIYSESRCTFVPLLSVIFLWAPQAPETHRNRLLWTGHNYCGEGL